MTDLERTILGDLRRLLERRVRLHALIAFGSRARGDADPESDFDVAVIVDGELDAATDEFVSECAWEAGFAHGIIVAPVAYARTDWEGEPVRHSLIALAIRDEGVAV
jgi:UTP:GlnB (protein PII) uridylyltransferase